MPAQKAGASRNRDPEQEGSVSWAEVPFVSNADGYGKRDEFVRYVAQRTPLTRELGLEDGDIPARNGKPAYRVRVIVTNCPPPGDRRADGRGPEAMDGPDVIECLNGRCGDAERAHGDLKEDLAGGILPSGKFGANAAWWLGAVLALNTHALVRLFALGANLARAGWKRVRNVLLAHAGRITLHARSLRLRLSAKATGELQRALQRLDRKLLAPG